HPPPPPRPPPPAPHSPRTRRGDPHPRLTSHNTQTTGPAAPPPLRPRPCPHPGKHVPVPAPDPARHATTRSITESNGNRVTGHPQSETPATHRHTTADTSPQLHAGTPFPTERQWCLP